jgi:glycosyltransferase involved in cell wall biosynthesis
MKASVLVTAYNHAPFIAEALESILMQEVGFDYEVVIGEDCSTDGTREIVRDFHRRYPDRIRLHLPERNLGGNGNVIFGEILPLARGEYVALLDGDDYWTSREKLQRQVEYLDAHPALSMCFHQALNVHADGSSLLYSENFGYPFDRSLFTLQDIMFQNFAPTCSVVFRNRLFHALPPEFYTMPSGDWFLNVLNAEHGDIGYLDETWGVRRVHPGGLISMKSRKEKLLFNIECIHIIDRHLGHRFAREAREKLVEYHYRLMRVLVNESPVEARAHARACLRLSRFGNGVPRLLVLAVALGLGARVGIEGEW